MVIKINRKVPENVPSLIERICPTLMHKLKENINFEKKKLEKERTLSSLELLNELHQVPSLSVSMTFLSVSSFHQTHTPPK